MKRRNFFGSLVALIPLSAGAVLLPLGETPEKDETSWLSLGDMRRFWLRARDHCGVIDEWFFAPELYDEYKRRFYDNPPPNRPAVVDAVSRRMLFKGRPINKQHHRLGNMVAVNRKLNRKMGTNV